MIKVRLGHFRCTETVDELGTNTLAYLPQAQ